MEPAKPSTTLRPHPLRADDLLSIDHPLRPWPLTARLRLNPGVRMLVFAALLLLLAAGWVAVITAAVTTHPDLGRWTWVWWEIGLIVSAVLSYLLLVFGWERRSIPELALYRAPRELAVGVATGAGLLATAVALLAVGGVYRVSGFDAGYSPWVALLTTGLGAGIVEEIIFRGVALRLIEEWIGTWAAIGVTAVAFGASHLGNPQATWQGAVAIAAEAGVLLGAMYALTRSLWVVIGFHFAWNVVQESVFGLVVSGATSGEGWLVSSLTGPEWATGGIFGLEASLVTVIVATTAGVVASVLLHRSGQVVAPVWVRRRALMATQPESTESEHSS